MRPDILTSSGHYFNFLAPDSNVFDIETIAHALSNLCRFNGHVRQFYSVAQHSVLVSRLVYPEFALQGLLHDAVEAFVGDVAAPLKQLLPEYKVIEKRVEAVVFAQFGLPATLHPIVKRADMTALATEQRDLMPRHEDTWEWEEIPGIHPLLLTIAPCSPVQAKRMFLDRFQEITAPPSPNNLLAQTGETFDQYSSR